MRIHRRSGAIDRLMRVVALLGLMVAFPRIGISAETAGPVITSIRQFWSLSEQDRNRSLSLKLACDVTYYDGSWKSLWLQDDDGEAAYAVIRERIPSLRSGQRVMITGTMRSPNRDFSLEHAEFQVLGDATSQPLPAQGQFSRIERFMNKLVNLQAFVVRQNLVDSEHLHLTLSIEGQTVFAWLLLDPRKPPPEWTDANVRMTAVYGMRPGGENEASSIELKIPSVEGVEVLSWLHNDPRFLLPVTPIGTLAAIAPNTLVHVAGEVKAQDPGRTLLIRDATGQVELSTSQTRVCAIDERVEAVGFAQIEGTRWQLAGALYRPAHEAFVLAPATRGTLRVAAQVLELTPEAAASGQDVLITGVVTWSHPDADFFFVQDSSGGICVRVGTSPQKIRPPGRNVEVHGRTAMGAFAPVVVASDVIKLGDMVMPETRQISLETALTGVGEGQWVEMRGYVQEVNADARRTRIQIATSAGNFEAELPPGENLAAFQGALVRLHGVCTAVADDRRRLKGIKLLVSSVHQVQLEEAAPQDLFAQPARLLANLGQFGTLHAYNRRVKVSGVVLDHRPGQYVQIQEGTETLLVLSRQAAPLVPGDRIDAVGFLGRRSGRAALQEAVYRKTGDGPAPVPQPLVSLPAELDGHLVTTEARLIEVSSVGPRVRLAVEAHSVIFEAHLDLRPGEDPPPAWRAGSRLRLTGIYEAGHEEFGPGEVFHLRLRSPEDGVVLAAASPFTRERMLRTTLALAVASLAAAFWVVALRRRVRQQTGQMRTQLQREARLESELQRATKLESIGLLAGGIAHDFNNLLTVVRGNLSLALLDVKKDTEAALCLREAERAVTRARDLTQQLLTFAKGGAPIRTAVELADVVREVAQFALRGSKVRCAFDIAADLWAADVDRGQIGQVVQNIVINALQVMPEGGSVDIVMRNEHVDRDMAPVLTPGRYVKLSLRDHGPGIRPEDLPKIFDPYFTTKEHGTGLGLATVHSIVKKHLGHVTVESTPGRGATFQIWLPAAAASALVPVGRPAPPAGGQGRILFMDDEPDIRALGQAMLRRLGYEPTAVSDGAAAVKAYAAAHSQGLAFDVVILDLTVPGAMGGREALEHLRRLDPQVKAIVSSGYSNDEILANHRAHGFSGMVSKPYEAADLAVALAEVMKAPAPTPAATRVITRPEVL